MLTGTFRLADPQSWQSTQTGEIVESYDVPELGAPVDVWSAPLQVAFTSDDQYIEPIFLEHFGWLFWAPVVYQEAGKTS